MLLNMPAPVYVQKVLTRIEGEDWNGYQGVGDYSNSNENTCEVVSAAHEIRDSKHSATKNQIDIEGLTAYCMLHKCRVHREEDVNCSYRACKCIYRNGYNLTC